MKEAQNILIILTGSLGDLVRGLAIPKIIKSKYPDAKISWLVDDKWESIIKGHKYIDEIIVFERKLGAKGVFKLIKNLKQKKFDLTLDMQRIFKSGLMSWFSGAKKRIGFHKENSKEFNFIFNTHSIPYCAPNFNKQLHYLKFTEELGISSPKNLDYGLAIGKDEKPENFHQDLSEENYIALIMGSSWETKDWPLEKYVNLGKILAKNYDLNIVLIGDPSQSNFAKEVEKKLIGQKIINLTGKTNLRSLIPLMYFAKLVVGPDSGPAHICAAVKTPYVSLFGPTPEDRVAPFGYEHLVVTADVSCRPCYKKKCPGMGGVCMKNIRPESVMEKVELVI